MVTMFKEVATAIVTDQLNRMRLCFDVKPDKLIPMIEALIQQGTCHIIFIDTFIRAIGACDNSNYSEMVFKIDPLLLLAKQYNINITVLHHHSKTGSGGSAITSAHGSIAITGSVAHIMSLDKANEDAPTTIKSRYRYSGAGLGGKEFKGEQLNYNEATGEFWLSDPPAVAKEQRQGAKKIKLPLMIGHMLREKFQETNNEQGMFKDDIAQEVRERLKLNPDYPEGVANAAIRDAIRFGQEQQWFQEHPTHKVKQYHALCIHQRFWDDLSTFDAEADLASEE
jgi:hypothetical protein